MTNLLNEDLGELVLQAAIASRDVYAALASKGYERRQDVHAFEENEAGWPSNVESSAGAIRDGAPLDWNGTIGTTRGKSTTFALYISDVPAIQTLADFVGGDTELVSRISATSAYADTAERQKEAVEFDAVRLVRSVLNRAEAQGDTSDENLLAIYSELEPGYLADVLTGDLLFPIALRKLSLDSSLRISDDISIRPLTQEEQLARVVAVGGGSDANPFLVAAATHVVVLENREIDNGQGPLKRLIRFRYTPPGVTDADLVCEALTIASGLDVGYAQVCILPKGWADNTWKLALPPISNVATVAKYPLRLNDRGWLEQHDPIPLEALERLPQIFAALKSTDRRAQLASRRLAQTARRDRADDVLIDACIGIEALLGQQHSELVHRMGLRAATALSAVGWDSATAYEVLKKVYEHRSTIVHGGEPKKPTIAISGKEYSTRDTAVYLLRALLKAHLSTVPPWTPESLDDDLHGALAERQAARKASGPPIEVE